MITIFFKMTLRALLRRKGHAAINIFGLSVAMACAIIGYLAYDFNMTWDSFHEKKDHIYRVTTIRTIQDRPVFYAIMPSPADKVLRTEVPGVTEVVPLEEAGATVRVGDNLFSESVMFAGDGFFRMFTWPLTSGSPHSLADPGSVLLSREWAQKYFANSDPIGKKIEIRIGDDTWKVFSVGGVLADLPKNSSLRVHLLMNISVIDRIGSRKPDDWKDWTGTIFIEAADPSVAARAVAQLNTYVPAQNSANPDLPVSGFRSTPLSEVALESRDVRNNMLMSNPPLSSFVGTLVSAVLILLLACFNYINTSIASAASRLKEVGIRKVVGGSPRAILLQFLSEQIFLCAVALMAALGVAELLIKGWNTLWVFMPLSLSYSGNWPLIAFMGALILAVAVGAGFYPAWYISRFRPALIFRGQTIHARISGFMRGMLVLQFGLSLITVIQAVSFATNARYVEALDLGYTRELRMFMLLDNPREFEALRNELLANPQITAVSRAADHIGFGARRREISHEGKTVEATTYRVDARYPELMGLRLVSGRLFDQTLKSDPEEGVLINQETAKAFGWTDAIGRPINFDGKRYRVIGVVENLLNRGVWNPMAPVLFKCLAPDDYSMPRNYAVVGMKGPGIAAAAEFVKRSWLRVFPDRPFEGTYQDMVVAEAIEVSENITTMSLWIGVMSMMIAGLGLYALVSLQTVRRTKEIGVRKVLGASVVQIIGLINQEFIILLAIALVIGDVLGYFTTKSLMNAIYAYNAGMSAAPFLAANLVSLSIAAFTAILIVYRAATVNPVKSLRYE